MNDNTYPKLLTGVPDPPGIKLHDYQIFARDFLLSRPRSALFLDMGTGKTLITLCAIYAANPVKPVLIVAPPNIAKASWSGEIKKWGFDFDTVSFLLNENNKNLSKSKRLKLYETINPRPNKPTIYIISNKLVRDLIGYLSSNGIPWPFGTVVIDESQSFKNHGSKGFEALKTVLHAIDRMVLLSGTPMPNGPLDLWSQIYMLDGGARLGHNITFYRNNYFNVVATNNKGIPIKYTPKPGATEYIYNVIRDVAISIKNTNLKLPELIINDIPCSMTADELKLYMQLKQDKVVQVYDELTKDSKEIDAANAAVLTGKLVQMASGSLYDEDGLSISVHDEKIEAMESIINNTDSPILVLFYFTSDKEKLISYLTKNKLDFQEFNSNKTVQIVEDWNAGKIPILLAHPASVGHGLNLQDGPGHTAVWYTLPFNLEHYMQANKRLHRQGQKSSHVMMHRLICTDTIDEKLITVLKAKEHSQTELLDVLDGATGSTPKAKPKQNQNNYGFDIIGMIKDEVKSPK